MKPVSAAEMREIERRALTEYGISGRALMEHAGRGAAEIITRECPGLRILVICGKGNNGGDGFVTARYLAAWKHPVQVCLAAAPESLKNDALFNFQALPSSVSWVVFSDETREDVLLQAIQNNDVIVDSLLGIGLHQPVQGVYRKAIEIMNRSGKKIYSLDIPSGMDPGTPSGPEISVTPYATITFGAPKIALSAPSSPRTGRVLLVQAGFPNELFQKNSL